MTKLLETYRKLDHTCCLNSSTMKYGIITDDETDRDCKDIEEMTDCLDDLEKVAKALEILKKYPTVPLSRVMQYISNSKKYGWTTKDHPLEIYDIPYNEEEFNLLKEVLK